jgi:hypothetical protein
LIRQLISILEAEEQNWWSMNAATAHTTNSTMAMLQDFFGEYITSQNVWYPTSPDLLTYLFLSLGIFKRIKVILTCQKS